MRKVIDTELNCRVQVYDSFADMIDVGNQCDTGGRRLTQLTSYTQAGWRDYAPEGLGTADGLANWVAFPWAEGLGRVRRMAAALEHDLPPAKNVRRTQRWNDQDGDVDVWRAMAGDSMMFRDSHRSHGVGPKPITLLANIWGDWTLTREQISLRGAAVAATADVLEAAGYQCEIWAYALTLQAFTDHRGGPLNSFAAIRVKECGDPVDVDMLAKALSDRALRLGYLRSMIEAGTVASGSGHQWNATPNKFFAKHCDMATSDIVTMPFCTDHDMAVAHAKRIVAQVTGE